MRSLLFLLVGCAPHLPTPPTFAQAPVPSARTAVSVRGVVVAEVEMSAHQAVAGADKDIQTSPVWAFVLEHPREGLILVDTAFGRRTAADLRDYPGRLSSRFLDLSMGTPLVERLPEMGAAAEDVRHIVLTHIHTDHAGGVEDFPDATLWVSEADWSWGAEKRRFHGVDPLPYEGRTARSPVYDDGPIGPFAEHADLFGDGSVRVIPAPGHTPGSQLVWVHGAEQDWLFLGDVAWSARALEEGRPKGYLPRKLVEVDWRANMDALLRARSLLDTEGLVLVAGHEPTDVERFPAWPALWDGAPAD